MPINNRNTTFSATGVSSNTPRSATEVSSSTSLNTSGIGQQNNSFGFSFADIASSNSFNSIQQRLGTANSKLALSSKLQDIKKNLIPTDLLQTIKSVTEAGLFTGTDFDDLTEETVNDLVLNSSGEDLAYGQNTYQSDFILKNLQSVLSNSSKTFQNLEMPNVVSHEIVKVTYLPNNITNESSLLPSQILSIKKDYLDSIQIPNANRYFLFSDDSKILRQAYVDNLKDTKKLLDKTFKNVKVIIDESDEIKVKNNFGNKIVNFYLKDQKSSSIGKIATILLDNETINYTKASDNSKMSNSFLNNFFFSGKEEEFVFLKEEDEVQKIFDLKISQLGAKDSYLKNASENKKLVNTDRIIGQNILNLSISLNGFYKDALSYRFWSSTISSSNKGGYLNSIIDSEPFSKVPILKLESIISIEKNSSGLFNNFNNDEIYNSNTSIFDLSRFEEFKTLNKLTRDSKGKISSINSKTFKYFEDSTYLTNRLTNYSYIVNSETFQSQTRQIVKEKEKFASRWDNTVKKSNFDFSKYIKKYFNPFIVSGITIEKNVISEANQTIASSSDGRFQSASGVDTETSAKISVYDTDIKFLKHNLAQEKSILRQISQRTDKYKASRAKSVLSGTKFLFFAGKTKNSRFNTYSVNNSGPEFQEDFYNIDKIQYICLDSSRNFHARGDAEKTFVRKFINPIDIDITQSSKKGVYINTDPGNSYVNDQIRLEINTGNERDFWLEESILGAFKGEIDNNFSNTFKRYQLYNSMFEKLENNKQDIALNKGFALFENTQNKLDINKIADKFVKYDNSLTKDNEFLNSRLISCSSQNDYEVTDNIDLVTDSLKTKTFKNDTWEKISFDLRRNLFDLKEKKLKRENKRTVLNYLSQVKNKAKNIQKQNSQIPYLTLLYSDDFKNSLDTIEKSEFTLKDPNGNAYKKFDFSESQEGIKNTLDFMVKNNSQELTNFNLNSNIIQEFLSLFYTNSELKSSSTFFNYCYKNTTRILSSYMSSTPAANRKNLCYDKLLSDAVLSEDSLDLSLGLVISALIKHKNIGISEDFEEVNEKSSGIYQRYLEKIYAYKNVQRQKSYTLRTVKFPNLNISCLPENKNRSSSTNQASFSLNGDNQDRYIAKIADHNFNFGVMPGETHSICFPFLTRSYMTNVSEDNSQCCAYDLKNNEGLAIADRRRFKEVDDPVGSCESLYEFVFSNFYNYDVYLDSSSRTLGENNFLKETSFNIEENNVSIFNIIRREKKDDGTSSLNKNTDYRNILTGLTETQESIDSENPKTFESNIRKTLNYQRYGVSFKDFGFYTKSQPKLKSFFNKTIIEFLKYVDVDFDTNVSDISSLEDAVKYAQTFSDEVPIFTKLLKFSCNLFSTVFDLVIEGSVQKNIVNYIDNYEEKISYVTPHCWEKEFFDLLGLESLIKNYKKYSFEKNIESESDLDNIMYTKLHADIMCIDKTLNNSDILEIMSFDTLISYHNEFEKFKTQTSSFDRTKELITDLEEEAGITNLSDVIFDDVNKNLFAKKINDYYYYQNTEFQKINQKINSDFSIDLREHFKSLLTSSENGQNFYSTHLLEEENKGTLSAQGSALLNVKNLNYDIIRIGIDQNMAKILSNNKLLKFKCHITNHKYPNLFIPPVYYFYTPVFTEITPSHLSLLENTSQYEEGIFVDDFIGMYDFNTSDIKERYNVASFAEAVQYIALVLLDNVNNERIFRNESVSLSNDGLSKIRNAYKIVTDAILSNTVKYCNYRTQKNINENKIGEFDENVSILGELGLTLFETMSITDFENTFTESYSKATASFGIDNNNVNNFDVVNNQAHSVEFFKQITKYIDEDKVSETFNQKRFYDIFSIVIGRKDIEEHIYNYYESNLAGLPDKPGFFDSFSYIIEAEIV